VWATVILLVSLTALVVVGASPPDSAHHSVAQGPTPEVITSSTAWNGVNYSATCSGCLPPDAQLASGAGYVVEAVNASYEVWTTGGTFVASSALSVLFGTGTDPLTDPQLRFDPTALRWFASIDDLHNDQIYYGASVTSDPTGSWNIQHFNIAGGDLPLRSTLGVDALNLVVATNLFSRATGAFLGSQVWVANKTQLMSGGGVATTNFAANPSYQALYPAEAQTPSATMYLVSDGTGGGTSFDLLTLTGSPPGATTLSSGVTFPISTTAPPNAAQAGSAKLVSVGDGRVESAIWRAGTLWAAATDGCVPSNDTILRSCLHLWELTTAASTMVQNFVWSTGPGTYDFYPALATDPSGELTIVFGESSASTDPGVFVTGQTSADALGSLEPAVLLKAGTGPDAPGSYCAGAVCPFGGYFGAAFEPFSGDRFWVVGEYIGSNSSTVFWHTWVASVVNVLTYAVNFTESGLPIGTPWSVTLNGNTSSSDTSKVVFLEPAGNYTYSVLNPISGTPGTRFVAAPTGGSFELTDQNVSVTIEFTKQYRLTTGAVPSDGGSIDPGSSWVNAASSVSLRALANSNFAFRSWEGNGSGSYNGSANPSELVMGGPIFENASFVNSTTYSVTFIESGLPSGTLWNVTLNGLPSISETANVSFNVTNGSYTYVVQTPIHGAAGVDYAAFLAEGTFVVRGMYRTIPVPYTTEYLLTTSSAPVGAGSDSPATGWFAAGSLVNVSAVPAAGYAFLSWTGSGPGNYSGGNDPGVVTMNGPILESADFQPISHPSFEVRFGVVASGAGNITFNGQVFTNNQTILVPPGTYALSQAPSVGWEFAQWAVAGGVTLGRGVVNVTGAGWINASYAALHLVSIVTAPAACGSVSVAGNAYADGASVALVNGTYPITASACGNFSMVSIAGTGGAHVSGNRLNVSGAGTVVATFVSHPAAGASPTGINTSIPLWALLLVAGLAVALLLLFLFGRSRRPRQPLVPAGISPGAANVSGETSARSPPPESVPEWDEGAGSTSQPPAGIN
jgi:hypothetical protein